MSVVLIRIGGVMQGRIQDFKLGVETLKIIENLRGILCEKSRFYAKKSYFFKFFGVWGGGCAPPTGSAPVMVKALSSRVR